MRSLEGEVQKLEDAKEKASALDGFMARPFLVQVTGQLAQTRELVAMTQILVEDGKGESQIQLVQVRTRRSKEGNKGYHERFGCKDEDCTSRQRCS